jgi:hypothetical protein
MGSAVRPAGGSVAQSPSTPAAPTAGGHHGGVRTIPRSSQSFKVLTECPIIIVLLFQLYRMANENLVEPFVQPVLRVRPAHHAGTRSRPSLLTSVCAEGAPAV